MSDPDLSVLSDAAIWCRTEGHQFAWVTDVVTARRAGVPVEWERQMACRECGAPARRMIAAGSFEASPRKITAYPDDYLIKGSGRISKAEVRREQFRRMGVVAQLRRA